ncbi:MAG: hypothetical protein ABEJ95_06470 [Candidatus Nanohalobium sp.]
MSHGGSLPDTCKFGHIIESEGGNKGLKKKIRKGEIETLSDLREEDAGIIDLLGKWKHIKVSAGSQGDGFKAVFIAVDELDTGKDFNTHKVDESIHISPQSNFHSEFMQRKQQAEQNIKQTMQSYQQLIKQKHMLEHDVRKLRSRVEAIESKDETLLKGDFIELVDGAGQSPRQGGDQMSLKAYRDQNIYPSIVADFNEMESVDDLKTAKQKAEDAEDKDPEDFRDGALAELPTNEKAVLKKKYRMYQQWKDLYGSEVSRKLDELKGQLRNVERSIEETKEWLKPYVRDVSMINKMGDDQANLTGPTNIRGNSTMIRSLDYILYKGMRLEDGELTYAEGEEATHYRVVYIKGVNANLAGFSQPQSPAEGPSAGIVQWFPAFVCKHVFENIFKPRINEHENKVEEVMEDYVGGFKPSKEGKTLRDKRQEEEMSVRELREKIEEELEEENVPVELSAQIRRIEDGMEPVNTLNGKYLEAIDSILDTEFTEDEDNRDNEMVSGLQEKLLKFTGKTDPFYMENPEQGLIEHEVDLRYDYYWGFKIGLGLYTMK